MMNDSVEPAANRCLTGTGALGSGATTSGMSTGRA